MPNHVTNKIIITGPDERILQLIEAFTTHHDSVPSRTFDGEIIYKNGEKTGWLNENTGVFRTRDNYGDPIYEHDKILEGYEILYEDAWTAMPDFNKIVPMPESLNIELHSGIENAVKAFLNMGYHENEMIAALERVSRINAKSYEDLNDEEKIVFDKAVENVKLYGHMYWYDWRIENWGTKWGGYSYEKVNENTFKFNTAWSGVPDMIEKMSLQFPDVTIEYKWADEDTGYNCGKAVYHNGEVSFEQPEGGSFEAYELAFELNPDSKEYYILVDGNYKYKEEEEYEQDED